ncbi:hypothetical protein MKX01_039176, partial [Papaver californicum]
RPKLGDLFYTVNKIDRCLLIRAFNPKKEKTLNEKEHGTDSGLSLKDDILSKALGEDRPGRVKSLGFGVTRSKLTIQSQYTKTIKNIVEAVESLSTRIVTLEKEKNLRTVFNDGSSSHRVGEGSSSHRIGEGSSSHRIGTLNFNYEQSGAASNNTLVSPSDISPTGGSPGGASPSSRSTCVQVLKKGQACKLLSWYKEGEVTADGRIQETDSVKKIHGMPIGFGAYSVWVDYALVDDALLYRPTSEFRFVHKAIGPTVAWPKDCIYKYSLSFNFLETV